MFLRGKPLAPWEKMRNISSRETDAFPVVKLMPSRTSISADGRCVCARFSLRDPEAKAEHLLGHGSAEKKSAFHHGTEREN